MNKDTGNSAEVKLPRLVINLAPTGMVPTHAMSPHVPLQPDEIVRCVLAAAVVGVTMVHLHARDIHGKPTHSKEIYARIIAGIREVREDLVICVSCSGRDVADFARRSEVLELVGDLKPDMASLTLSSMNFSRQASVNEPEMVQALASKMIDRGIVPELEVFDLGMANYANYLAGKFRLERPYYLNVIVGNVATAQADLLSIAVLANAISAGAIWSLGGVGDAQIPVSALAVAMAPGVRIGLEDNLWSDRKRARLTTNQEMVERVHQLASLVDREIMSSDELRTRLGLRTRQVLQGDV